MGSSCRPQTMLVSLSEGMGCLAGGEGRVHLSHRPIPTCFAHLQRHEAGNTPVFVGPSTELPQLSPWSPFFRVAAEARGKSLW